ncbi:unnamed protein product, partial [Laminaria digitata]
AANGDANGRRAEKGKLLPRAAAAAAGGLGSNGSGCSSGSGGGKAKLGCLPPPSGEAKKVSTFMPPASDYDAFIQNSPGGLPTPSEQGSNAYDSFRAGSDRSISSSLGGGAAGGDGFRRPQLPEPRARAPVKSEPKPESKVDSERQPDQRRRPQDRYQAGVDRVLAGNPQDTNHQTG